LKAIAALGVVGIVLAASASPASAGWPFGRRVVVTGPSYTVVSPAPVYAAPVVAAAPVATTYETTETVVSAPVQTTYVAPTTTTTTTYVAPAPVYVRRAAPLRVVYPRRVYVYPY